MIPSITRRGFASVLAVGATTLASSGLPNDDEKNSRGPVEAEFERDYEPPKFKPDWKNPQINRLMVQDFVIYAHSDLEMVKQLYKKQPALLNSCMDWGNGDWETALGGASHMGRKDIVRFLLSKGARMDIFCAAMMGMVGTVKEMLKLEPALVDAKGPHGFSLEFHAKKGKDESKEILELILSLKENRK